MGRPAELEWACVRPLIFSVSPVISDFSTSGDSRRAPSELSSSVHIHWVINGLGPPINYDITLLRQIDFYWLGIWAGLGRFRLDGLRFWITGILTLCSRGRFLPRLVFYNKYTAFEIY